MTAQVQATATNLGPGSGVTIDVPAGTVDGDLLVVFLITNANPDEHPDWTTIKIGVRTWTAYRIASSEPASYTFTNEGLNGRYYGGIKRISGHDSANPINASASFEENSTTAPAVTTTVDDCLVLRFIGGLTDDTIVAPTDHTLVWSHIDTSTSPDVQAHCASEVQATAGDTGTAAWNGTWSGEGPKSYTIAIAPSSGLTASGDPSAQDSTVSGEATLVHEASGTPASQDSTVSGTAKKIHFASGDLLVASSEVSGSATADGAITASGDLAAQDSDVSGQATKVLSASGDLQAQDSKVTGLIAFPEVLRISYTRIR